MSSLTALANVIYRRIVRDVKRRHMTLEDVEWSAEATLKTL